MNEQSELVKVSLGTANQMWLRGFNVTIDGEQKIDSIAISENKSDILDALTLWQYYFPDSEFTVDKGDLEHNTLMTELIDICTELNKDLNECSCWVLFTREDIQSYAKDYIQEYEYYPFCYAKPYVWQPELSVRNNIERILVEKNIVLLNNWIAVLAKEIESESSYHDLKELQEKVKSALEKSRAYSLRYDREGKSQGLLYSIEQNGEVRHYLAKETDLSALIQKGLSEKPYAALMECGIQMELGEYAEIQQSTSFVCQLEFNFDVGVMSVYRVKGNIPESDRDDSNCVFGVYTFDELREEFADTDAEEADEDVPCTFFDYLDSGIQVEYTVDSLIGCCERELDDRGYEDNDIDKGYCHAIKICVGLAMQLRNELEGLEGEKITLDSFIDAVQRQMKRGISNAKRSQFDVGYASAMSDCLDYLQRMKKETCQNRSSVQKTSVF